MYKNLWHLSVVKCRPEPVPDLRVLFCQDKRRRLHCYFLEMDFPALECLASMKHAGDGLGEIFIDLSPAELIFKKAFEFQAKCRSSWISLYYL